MKGMIAESIETNLKVLSMAPDFAIAHNNLAIAYLESGSRNWRWPTATRRRSATASPLRS